MNKGAAFHALADFQLAFHDDEDMEIEQESFSTVLPCDCQLSKTNRSSCSTWEFVHAFNTVVGTNDIQSLKQAWYFTYF